MRKLILIVVAIEMTNFGTTYFSFSELLGTAFTFLWLPWGFWLAVGLVVVDFGGIVLYISGMSREFPLKLAAAWLLAAVANICLTAYAVLEMVGASANGTEALWFPICIAVAFAAIRIAAIAKLMRVTY